MANSHEQNSLENHLHIMCSKVVTKFQYLFDDSFIDYVPNGSNQSLPGNQIVYDDSTHDDEVICYGQFRFDRREQSHHFVRLAVEKYLAVILSPDGLRLSRTAGYKYNIWLDSPRSEQKTTRILRFDNGDDYGYSTKHHLHIQVDSPVESKKQWPYPAHVGESFPYLSDVLEICASLVSSGESPTKNFDELLERFKRIPDPERQDPNLWVPRLHSDLFDFILT